MSALEREVLSVLARNPTSPVVSYMPAGRTFGIGGLSESDQLVIIKIGREVRLVSQATGFVYGLETSSGNLVRLDSNNVFGLEYRIDPFVRKDTMFMVATSNFLKGKGFLAYYDPAAHEWKAYRGNDAVMKESTRPYYDPREDHLYLVCNYVYQEEVDTARSSADNVMRFSFGTGRWDMVGRLDTDVYSSATNVPVRLNWAAGFGAGNLEEGDFNVVQPNKNRWLSTDSSFRTRMQQLVPSLHDTDKLLQLIHMGDTIYAFSGTVDSVRVYSIPLRESDFTVLGGKALYDIVDPPDQKGGGSMIDRWGFAFLGLALFAVVLLWNWKRRSTTVGQVHSVPGTPGEGVGGQMNSTQADMTTKQPIHYFLESLTPVERSLVLELAHFANRGEMMETQALNQILGVSQKEPEVQKVRRSLTITRINSNFGQMLAPDVALIRREKDPSDKRVFLYYVTKEHAAILLGAGSTKDL